jgi:phospholipid/cholesterol/gamma-HCH transport system substrate-binding protein
MKKIRFSPMERTAGIFILLALFGMVAAAGGILVRRGFFEPKIPYFARVKTSEGLKLGTPVRMAGLKAGALESIEMQPDSRVRIGILVFERYGAVLREGTELAIVRPTVIGDKAIDIIQSAEAATPLLARGAVLPANEAADLLESLNARKLTAIVENLEHVSGELAAVFGKSGNQKNAERLLANITELSTQARKLAGEVAVGAPGLRRDLAAVTAEFARLAPLARAAAEGVPESTRKLMDLVRESTVLIKAAQKSFLLRGNVRDVRDEEAAKTGP